MARRKLTGDQVLDELAWLATVEHALCVDYLLVHYALRTVVDTAPQVAGAVEEALSIAQNAEMHHLARVNRVLVKAGRAPVVERAAHVVPASGSPVPLGALTLARFAAFPKHEAAVASVVDARYARVREAAEAPKNLLDPEVLGALTFLLDTVGRHAERVETLAGHLRNVDLSSLLHDLRLTPADDLERDVMALSNRYYRTVVENVAVALVHEPFAGGPLLSAATSTMLQLDAVNGVLATQGLVPAFDLSG